MFGEVGQELGVLFFLTQSVVYLFHLLNLKVYHVIFFLLIEQHLYQVSPKSKLRK